MTGLDPNRANLVVGVGVVLLVGAAGYVAYQTFHAQERGTRANQERPDDQGAKPSASPRAPDASPAPKIRLVLTHVATAVNGRPGVRIALEKETWALEDDAPDSRKDVVWDEVSAAIRRRLEAQADAAAEIQATIADGPVPHAAVMRALDAFIGAGISDVGFLGPEAGTPR